MDHRALDKSEIRYRVAEKAVQELTSWKSFAEFDDAWYTFLRAWKGIYTALEQGAKASQTSTQWFGTKNAFRRRDPLLQYIYQSRNDDEHGLEDPTAKAAGGAAFRIAPKAGTNLVHIKSFSASTQPGSITIHECDTDGTPIIEIIGPKVTLRPVTDRSGKTYQPPVEHLGERLTGTDPLSIARIGLNYARKLLDEATTLS